MSKLHSIVLQKVQKRFGNKLALRNVSVSIDCDKVVAIVGANGAGKSTLMSLCAMLSRPSKGEVLYKDDKRKAISSEAARASIGMLSHASFLYNHLTAFENIQFFAEAYRVDNPPKRAEHLLDVVGLQKDAWHQPVHTYSRGMVQRTALARSLAGKPKLLLLDEPFTGLDASGVNKLIATLEELKQDKIGVVLVTHELAPLAPVVDRSIGLKRGKVVHDESKDVWSASELQEIYTSTL